MRVLLLTVAALAGLVAASAGAAADDDKICADRPGKASATCTVPAGHLQTETALADWSLQRGGGERDSELTIAATAIKYGLDQRTHIEVDVVPFVHDATRSAGSHETASGIGDTLVRVKHRLTADDAAVEVALYPFVKLPTAGHRLGNGNVEAGLAVPVGYAIPHSKLTLALTPEFDWRADEDGHGRHAAMVQVASLGWAVSDAVTVSGELWGEWDWDPAQTTRQASADAAIAFVPRPDLQLDGGANVGLNRATPDIELYVGLAKRF